MPNSNTNVQLDVQTGAPPDNTWKKCTDGAGNEIDFCCKYTGGNYPADDPDPPPGGPGFFQATKGQGAMTAHVSLVAADIWQGPNGNGFKITDIDITYDPPNPTNPNISVNGSGSTQRQIVDKAEDVQIGDYTVVVAHRDKNGTEVHDIHCDPGWRNK